MTTTEITKLLALFPIITDVDVVDNNTITFRTNTDPDSYDDPDEILELRNDYDLWIESNDCEGCRNEFMIVLSESFQNN